MCEPLGFLTSLIAFVTREREWEQPRSKKVCRGPCQRWSSDRSSMARFETSVAVDVRSCERKRVSCRTPRTRSRGARLFLPVPEKWMLQPTRRRKSKRTKLGSNSVVKMFPLRLNGAICCTHSHGHGPRFDFLRITGGFSALVMSTLHEQRGRIRRPGLETQNEENKGRIQSYGDFTRGHMTHGAPSCAPSRRHGPGLGF